MSAVTSLAPSTLPEGRATSRNIDTAELHKYIPWHRESLRRALRQGRIPSYKVGRKFVVRQEDVERFLDSNKYSPTQAANR